MSCHKSRALNRAIGEIMADMNTHNRAMRRIGLAFAAMAWMSAACGSNDPCLSDDPRDVVKQYLSLLDAQNEAGAFECLSRQAQDALTQRADAFNAANPGSERKPSEMLRAGHVIASTREYKKFEIQSQDGAQAAVGIIMQDGSQIPVLLRRDGTRWAVDLAVPNVNLPLDRDNSRRIAD